MPRGGYRVGAGRKPSQKTLEKRLALAINQESPSDEMPLQYLLRVMRDPTVDPARRDRAAQMAAPYCHPRMYDNRFGKRDAALEEAHKATEDSEWADDLGPVDQRTVN
jgi:hypothetical protein